MEDCGVTAEQYDHTLGCVEKKVSILYKRKPCEINIGPYENVILKLLKSNMNLSQVHMLAYLTSYFYKPEHGMSELMKKASKEPYVKELNIKCFLLVIHF